MTLLVICPEVHGNKSDMSTEAKRMHADVLGIVDVAPVRKVESIWKSVSKMRSTHTINLETCLGRGCSIDRAPSRNGHRFYHNCELRRNCDHA